MPDVSQDVYETLNPADPPIPAEIIRARANSSCRVSLTGSGLIPDRTMSSASARFGNELESAGKASTDQRENMHR